MTELTTLITTFLDPLALIMALVFAASILQRKKLSALRYNLVAGSLFAFAIIYAMSDPIPIYDGGIFDMRFLLIGAATALIGPVAGGLTLATASAYRMFIGGDGVVPGVVGAIIVFAAAWAWRAYIKDIALESWKKSTILGLMMTLHSLSIFLGPAPLWGFLFANLMPYMLVTNVLGALLIKRLLYDEIMFFAHAEGLRVQAGVDHLTGLPNRRQLEAEFNDLANRGMEPGFGIGVLYFDVDQFKQVNDQYGHGIGDAVLEEISERVQGVLRTGDIFSRVGGDEFAIVLPDLPPNDVKAVAERCRIAIIEQSMIRNLHDLDVSISIGAVWYPHMPALNVALTQADIQLYSAKKKGRDQVAFQMASRARARELAPAKVA